MPKLEAYSADLPYSYALGIYPSMQLLTARPELARRLLLRTGCEVSDGVSKLRALCAARGVREEFADKALARLARKENCYAALVFDKRPRPLAPDAPHVVLHQVADGGNLGSILRTCAGLGVRDVAVIRPCADAFDPHVVRASMGAFFRVNLSAFDTYEDYRLSAGPRACYPFMLDGATRLDAVQKPAGRAFSLIFGNEQRGLPEAFQDAGTPVCIPQSEQIDSLNLAAAVAIGVYAFMCL
jgi:TrmH family RNA methyltransferase